MTKTNPESVAEPTEQMEILSVATWSALVAEHEARVGERVRESVARRGRGISHPVYDFLFTYYSQRPSHLLRWSPGVGRGIEVVGETEKLPKHFCSSPFRKKGDRIFLDGENLSPHLRRQAVWIAEMCRLVSARPPVLNCYGLHEWAMVYAIPEGQQRHEDHPLRLPADALRDFVDGQSLCCTHYDAFRFFTPEAAPLNRRNPTYEDRLVNEQPGCVHTNMDLYKWCYKLGPWCPGELLAESFLFAQRTRELDMRASPYDLKDLGFAPIKIETAEGRREYAREQSALAHEAEPIREQLLAVCEAILI